MQSAQSEDGTAILRRIGLTLPPSAQVDHAEQVSGMDDAARLSMTMSGSDWREFSQAVARTAGQELVFSEDDNFLLGAGKTNWHPEAIAGLKTAQLLWAGGTQGLNIGTAPATDGTVRVLIFWHQT